jgi:cobalamin biosynthesis protein CobD/CbiB
MNELDPSLKRLLKLSRTAEAPEPQPAPFGFFGRVAAATKPARQATLLQELQQRAFGIACASLALVIAGALVLLSQRTSAAPEPEISSALNFVANNLLQ